MRKLLFVPNWNGHLHINEYNDNSVTKLFDKVEIVDRILVPVEKNNITKTNENIAKYFKESNGKVLSVNGDHSCSYPLIKEFSKKNKEFKLVIFDAHPDVEVDTGIVSHEDYLRNLIDEGIVKGENVYLFGIRTFSRTEYDYLVSKKVNFYSITDVLNDKKKIKGVLESVTGDVYLSIDIDVLDPDDAPGTYYTEYCGLRMNELKDFLRIVKSKADAIDICEFYAEKDENNVTLNNVLELIYFLSN